MPRIELIGPDELRTRLKSRHPSLRKDANIGIVGTRLHGKDARVDIENGNRDVVVTANTARVDEDDEVVVPSGAVLDYFKTNGCIFIDHKYSWSDWVGGLRSNYPILKPAGWMVRFAARRSPDGEQLLKDVEDFGVGVSIGFDALDVGPPTDEEIEKYGKGNAFRSIVRKWRWVELSVTAMPCNVECRSVAPETPKPAKRRRPIWTPDGVIVPAY